ncbi:MAG: hypothetical protein KBG15_03985 [Kofleriaceae bacterium]|nr:hypothetical protein [Kofleriaceae bacterium]
MPTRRLRVLLFGIFLGVAMTAAGCRSVTGPEATLDRYARLLQQRDYAAAYDLMSGDYRARVTRDDYVKFMRDAPREVADTADKLRAHRTAVEVSAEFTFGLGESLRLIQERGRWRIAQDALNYYDQTSPRAALRAFVRAYQLQRWDVMLRFVPAAYAAKMTAEQVRAQFTGPSKEQIDALVAMLSANTSEPISESGNVATLNYGVSNEVSFVREDGIWKIKDLD